MDSRVVVVIVVVAVCGGLVDYVYGGRGYDFDDHFGYDYGSGRRFTRIANLPNYRYRPCTGNVDGECNVRDGNNETYTCQNLTVTCGEGTNSLITRAITGTTMVCAPRNCNRRCYSSLLPRTNVTSCSRREWTWTGRGWRRECTRSIARRCCEGPNDECLMGNCLQVCGIGLPCPANYGCRYTIRNRAMNTTRSYCQAIDTSVCSAILAPGSNPNSNPGSNVP